MSATGQRRQGLAQGAKGDGRVLFDDLKILDTLFR
ncbi:hypothetical protein PSYRMG_20985 [Pseudomonas syringae UMAF0158]|nr:hypothetical protein PSYRMG_20985 [Pseudomonas syringae UMAF0158]